VDDEAGAGWLAPAASGADAEVEEDAGAADKPAPVTPDFCAVGGLFALDPNHGHP
jgi:hypothetical protein